MNTWETTVWGDTHDDIYEAADAEYQRFFSERARLILKDRGDHYMTLIIRPGEIVSTRDGSGHVVQRLLGPYEATVRVTWNER